MAVLQAAPQAGCVQGPIQPVFSAAAALMFIPGADVKLPSAEEGGVGGRDGVALHPFSVSLLCLYREMLNRKTRERHVPHLNKSLFSEPL